jgi:hypothetical protein
MTRYLMVFLGGLAMLVLVGCETTSGGSKYKQPTGLQRSYGGGP